MNYLIGRVGPAFEASKKYRIRSNSNYVGASLPICYVWDEAEYAYAPVSDEEVPLITDEFVDAVRVEFNAGVRYFIARQMDELIATITEDVWLRHCVPNNEGNFWFEEI